MCFPQCPSGTCPPAPSTFTGATPACALTDNATQKKYCVLECSPSDASSCAPALKCTCKAISGIGVCPYNETGEPVYLTPEVVAILELSKGLTTTTSIEMK